MGSDTRCGAVFAVREETSSSCSAKARIGPLRDFWHRFSFSHLLDSSSSLSLSPSHSRNPGSSLVWTLMPDPEDDLPLLLFTGVTGGTNVALWIGAGCPSTCSISEARQLAGQVGGPNNDRPSMTPCQTPHMFGITCASIMVWLKEDTGLCWGTCWCTSAGNLWCNIGRPPQYASGLC